MSDLIPLTSLGCPSPRAFSAKENPLYSYIAQRMICRVSPEDSKNRKICRCFSKAIAVSASFAAQVPYISICKKFAGDNDIYAGFLAYGDLTAFGTFLAWCYLTLIDDAMTPLTQEEKIMLSHRPPRCPPTLIKILIIAGSIIAQIPYAKGVADYNKPALLFALLSLPHAGVSIYSLHLSIQDFQTRKKLHGIELHLQTIRANLLMWRGGNYIIFFSFRHFILCFFIKIYQIFN